MDHRFIETLKSRIDIVDIVRRYAELKKSGKNFMARSPFRNERTPSFSVSPDRQMWYDFGISEGGDAISFLQKIENMSFMEAVESLAETANMEIPKEQKTKNSLTKNQKKDIFGVHETSVQYFSECLKQSQKALEYAKSRSITPKMIDSWSLGYGGEVKEGLTNFLLEKGFSETLINQSGVAFERSFGDQTMMDRFWGRFMIPIKNHQAGEIIAFSGRDILNREGVGKYINSPENPVYQKSMTLFGLDRAKSAIKEKNGVILVEGNIDVIFAHERGFCETVATCGTSLTEDHLNILKRFTKNIYLAFDNDLAGKKATLKVVEMCLSRDLNPFVIDLNEAKDLGDFLVEPKNTDLFHQKYKEALPALDFFFDRFALKNLDGSLQGEKSFLDAFFYFLHLSSRPVEQDDFLERLAKKLGRHKSVMTAEFEKFGNKKISYIKPKHIEEAKIKHTREESFLGFLLGYWDQLHLMGKMDFPKLEQIFSDPKFLDLLQKKQQNQVFTEEEMTQVLPFQMWQEGLLEDGDKDLLKKTFDEFFDRLWEQKQKKDRLNSAKKLEF